MRGRGQSVSIPSPVGGWNARDSLANMDPKDAVTMINWRPMTTECQLRYGYSQHATGLPGEVETLIDYEGGATSKLFAISNGSVYDVTSAGAVGAAVLSGLSNSRWQYCNFATAGGNFVIMANAVNPVYQYNGTAWSNPAITGVSSAYLNNPIVFKSRIWFIEGNTLKVWYLPVNSIAGAASQIDISSVVQLGGHVVCHGTWTIDAGQGVDDYYVAITSKGEVVVYEGTDPSSANTWALKGVWRIGSPVGKRCMYKFGGDLLLITQDGLMPLAAALQSSRVNPRVALTDKIQQAVSEAVSNYGDNFGWQVIYFARENQLWLNIPVQIGSQEQYAMNTISRNWAQYQGWAANCWELFQDDPYFGGNGFVGKAWDTNADNGTSISGTTLQSFAPYGAPGNLKRFTMIRPIFRTTGTPAINGSMNIDFDTSLSTAPLSFSPIITAVWDSGVWDSGIWGGGLTILQNWQGVNGVGYYAAPQINTAASGIDLRWVSTDVVYEVGAIL